MKIVRAAVVQAAPVMFDRDATLQKVRTWTAKAAAQGAEIAVFPEAFVSGYPKGLDFGARVGSRTAEGRAMFRRYFESALDVPGAAASELGAIARDHAIHLVIGVIEREGGTLYCAVLFFAPSGELLGKHRKLMPTAMERLIWGMGDGSTLPVLDTAVGRVGAVICWENYMPMLRMTMYAKGIQLYCAPTVDDRDTWARSMQHIAFEGRCFVLSAVQYLSAEHLPADYGATGPAAIRGGSVIVNPLGEVLAGPHYGGETMLTADLDLNQIAEGKFDLDVAGHYARPDVFQLTVNERSTPALKISLDSADLSQRDVERENGRGGVSDV
jgi:nitrilase